jgi:hypothetical protein
MYLMYKIYIVSTMESTCYYYLNWNENVIVLKQTPLLKKCINQISSLSVMVLYNQSNKYILTLYIFK